MLPERLFWCSFHVAWLQKCSLSRKACTPLIFFSSKVEFGVLQKNCSQASAKEMQMSLQDPPLLGSAYTCSKDLNYKGLTLQILTQLLLNSVNFNRFFELAGKIRQLGKRQDWSLVYNTQGNKKEYVHKDVQLEKLLLCNLVTKLLFWC